MAYTIASLFAGMGGIDIAFEQAGFHIVWANEVNSAACRTFRYNFGHDFLVEGDIKRINHSTIPDFDVLVAGFPCQPFSIGGKQRGFHDARGTLFFEIARVLAEKQPPVVFLENVANLLEHDNGRTFLVIYNTLVELGYILKYHVMNATEYGNLPQPRNRIFLVAFQDFAQSKRFSFPEPVPLTCTLDDIVHRSEKKPDIYYFKENHPWYARLHANANDRNYIYHIKDRGLLKVRNRWCPVLTANMGTYLDRVPVVKDDFGFRKLTLRECLDFQGFPQKFYFPNSIGIGDTYRQIGNSVAVTVIKRIAERVWGSF
ncbi:MAG: DNA (cytosine-5-)-methyltransferase [Eubacteriales bacterium]